MQGLERYIEMKKGDYGYLAKKKKKHIIAIIIIALLMTALMVTGIALTGKKENLLTILAIVLALPLANYVSTLVVFIKRKSCPKEMFDKFESVRGGLLSSCDMVITSRELVIPLPLAVIYENGVAAYTDDSKVNVKDAQKFIEAMLRVDGFDVPVHIFKDEGQFFGCVSRISKEPAENLVRLQQIKACLLSISM